tara:strand:- start:988 stop:1731 length:744 start_codon:yes stop_codon:yes gene_type:complete
MAKFLLKKSYLLKNLKEIPFNDLWGSKGVFTTMRLVGNKNKIVLKNNHINNLIISAKKYKIKKKNLKKIITYIIFQNLEQNYKNHLLRIALDKKRVSLSIRKRVTPKKIFKLKIFNYKRIEPKHKNLFYKKILKRLSKFDTAKYDLALCYKNKLLETGTSNLLFVKNGKYFSPKNNCYIGNTIKYLSKKIKINFKDININDLNNYQEIMLVGSGKGVTSVNSIDELKWKNQSLFYQKKINNIYKKLI